MGMFDTVRSSYPIFGEPWDQELQTKDLMCSLNHYWISPDGVLYDISYQGTHDMVIKPEEMRKHGLDLYEWHFNGTNGRVMFTPWYGVVELYPARWEGKFCDMPHALIQFRDGQIEHMTHSDMAVCLL